MWSAAPATQCALCWRFGHPAADCPKGPIQPPKLPHMWQHRAHSQTPALPSVPRRTSCAKKIDSVWPHASPQYVNCGTDHPANPSWAPAVGHLVVLLAEGAPGGCRGAVGGDVAPPTAPAAESVWSGLLEGIGLVTETR